MEWLLLPDADPVITGPITDQISIMWQEKFNPLSIDSQNNQHYSINTVKPVLRGHSKRAPKSVLNTDYRLTQVKCIAECSNGSILQYFRPSLSYYFPLRPFFCLFLSGCLRQV